MGFFRKKQPFGEPSRYRLNLGGKWTTLTALLVTGTVTLFVFAYGNRPSVQKPSSIMEILSLNYGQIAQGQLWRLFSSPFLFSGILQLFFATFAIFLLGGYAARRLGVGWFLFTYILCGIAGSLVSSIIVPGRGWEAAPAATFGVILMCMLYFPYMYFLGGVTARQLGPVMILGISLSSLSFSWQDLGCLGQLAGLPVAYGIYRLEPAIERIRSKRRLKREIVGAFTEAEREEKLDKLLKKVASSGMDSLNRKERHFLQTVSKEYRRNKVKNNH
jgi:membrane associated rhomboid family serine protease